MPPTDDFWDDLFLQQDVRQAADGRHFLTWEGRRYVLYLTDAHLKQLKDVLEPFLGAAEHALAYRQDAMRQTTISRAERKVNSDVRIWAAEQGYELPRSGPLPKGMREARIRAWANLGADAKVDDQTMNDYKQWVAVQP